MKKLTRKSINTIYDLLPEEMSDECAYNLVNFFMNITAELESCYFDQMRRYINDMENNMKNNTNKNLHEF